MYCRRDLLSAGKVASTSGREREGNVDVTIVLTSDLYGVQNPGVE